MPSNLETQAREALLRALPYIHDSRRELVLSVLMSNPTINDWYISWNQTRKNNDTSILESCAYYACMGVLTKSDLKYYRHWVAKLHETIDTVSLLNKLIDAHEPQNP